MTIPKEIFELRRTHRFLGNVKKALDALAEKAQRESEYPHRALEMELQALVYDFRNQPANAAKCRRERDLAVTRQRDLKASVARKKRKPEPPAGHEVS